MASRQDYTGTRYGYLTMMRYAHSGGENYGAMWEAICDCGVTRVVPAKNVTAGRTRSCGECHYHKELLSARRDGRSTVGSDVQRLYQRYLRRATRGCVGWALTVVELRDIISRGCELCGAPPAGRSRGSRIRHSHPDRLDMALPYTGGNTIPVCRDCQVLKGNRGAEQLLNHIARIISHCSTDHTSGIADPAKD